MRKSLLLAAAVGLALASPQAFAQGLIGGAQQGAAAGSAAAGPVGGVVGGAVGAGVGAATGAIGAATGAVGAVLGVEQQPQFRSYVATQNLPSHTYKQRLRVGATLPAKGVTYYRGPAEYGLQGYNYTVINGTPVVVQPRTRRVVQVLQ